MGAYLLVHCDRYILHKHSYCCCDRYKATNTRETEQYLFADSFLLAYHCGDLFLHCCWVYVCNGALTDSRVDFISNLSDVFNAVGIGIALYSYFAITGLSADRLLAVKYPFFYQRMSSKHLLLYGGICAIVIGGSFFLLVFPQLVAFIFAGVFWISTMFFVCIANLKIRQVVQEKCRDVNGEDTTTLNNDHKTFELKKTRICLILAFSFLLWWFPIILTEALKSLFSLRHFTDMFVCSTFISMLNSLFDPVFYIIRSKHLRAEIKELVYCGTLVERVAAV